MAIDGMILHRLSEEIKSVLPAKINKISQISEFELLFQIRAHRATHKLLISLHSVYNRINFTQNSYTTMETPQNFVMVLRKYLDGALITQITQLNYDRVLKMELEARNDLGDLHHKYLYIELMGKYANLILVDENQKIIDAMKRIPPFENTKRTILPNVRFVEAHQETKKDPFTCHTIDEELPLHKQFDGFSPLLSKEIQYRMMQGQTFDAIMQEVKASNCLYISDLNEQSHFHLIPLTHLEVKPRCYDLMHGLDVQFFEKEEKVRIKQQSGDLFRLVKRELTRNKAKLKKLNQALEEAMDCQKYREYGDLLFAYMHEIKKAPTITLNSFETNEPLNISIDMRYDIKWNANHYYAKYHKQTRAQSILLEQIDLCEKEIYYFEDMETQLGYADVKDAMEIREELVKRGYLKAQKQRVRKKKKNDLPHFDLFVFDDYKIYVGKNNLQNDYLTWKLARKNDLWLHVKDLHGSHVILDTLEPSEEALRNAAILAAWYSQGRHSSSVPVNYTPVKTLKKIPGNQGSLVSLSTYKTIYIDPEQEKIQALIDQHLSK